MISPCNLDRLMHLGWPPLTSVEVDGWIVRVSGGVTQRANSVLPIASPLNLPRALEEVEALYRAQGLASTFQVSPAAQPGGLDGILRNRGYEPRAPTLVQVAPVRAALRRLDSPPMSVDIDEEPGEDWMRLWWSVDGRGGAEARAIAGRIMTSAPALYATAYDRVGSAAVCRLALVDAWGGIYCMAVREEARGQGYGKSVLRALLGAAAERGIQNAWLQVVEQNRGARALYASAGFVDASRYHYRVMRDGR